MIRWPQGFTSHAAQVGIKPGGVGDAVDDSDDLVIIASAERCSAAGVFTRSRFAGPSVSLSRSHLADGHARAVVVVSKNANVATGEAGAADASEVAERVAARLGCDTADVLLASTGVIGRRYPMDRLRAGIDAIDVDTSTDVVRAARAIMTTDTVPKVEQRPIAGSGARLVGIAKGVGMIEPDMATMIAVLSTDADVGPGELDAALRRAVDRTFNCLSIDTDTSTSDTVVALASGLAGAVDTDALDTALHDVCLGLTTQIAADGEGAETVIEVRVDGARDDAQARRVAKSIVNSPLVKTAVHGADPNWGRVAMAIGKCQDDTDIEQAGVTIRFGDREVYPDIPDDEELAALSTYMSGDEVLIHVTLGTGRSAATVWGCDLTDGYVRINADYTT